MTRGRKPAPTAIKQLRGNPGKRPLNGAEPQAEPATGRAPGGLSAGALKFWRRYAPQLVRMGVLAQIDEPALHLMAEHFSLALRARAELETDGLLVADEVGNLRKNPLLEVFRDQSSAFRGYAGEFGMTPSARSRVKGPEQEEGPSLADELFGRAAQQVQAAAGRAASEEESLEEWRGG